LTYYIQSAIVLKNLLFFDKKKIRRETNEGFRNVVFIDVGPTMGCRGRNFPFYPSDDEGGIHPRLPRWGNE